MFKREMKINFKSFIIWSAVLIGLFSIVFLIYPSIMTSENIEMMESMMTMFPEEVLKTFNMDLSLVDSAYGWLKSEGFVMILLAVGCYSGILGSNILTKEENDKTIEYINSLPIKRRDIVLKKISAGFIYIISMILLLGIFNFIGLTISEDFDQKQFLLLSITPLFSSIVIFSFCLFISTFTHKTKKMVGISLGFVFASYILQMISEMGEDTKILKYISVFSLADIRNVITEISINPITVILAIALTIAFTALTLIRYERKELM